MLQFSTKYTQKVGSFELLPPVKEWSREVILHAKWGTLRKNSISPSTCDLGEGEKNIFLSIHNHKVTNVKVPWGKQSNFFLEEQTII